MTEERNQSDLNLYGAEDFEELEMILDALDRAVEADGPAKGAK